MSIQKVIIVGAGPSGLLLALLLAKHEITVEVLEAGTDVDRRPRAMILSPMTISMLQRVGLVDEIRAEAQAVGSTIWRDIDGNVLRSERTDGSLSYPVDLLCEKLADHVRASPFATLSMGHRVRRVTQDGNLAGVEVDADERQGLITASLVIGCDGASSIVREEFDLEVLASRINGAICGELVVANIRYDIHEHKCADVQLIVDPTNWGMVASVSRAENLWRVVTNVNTKGEHDKMQSILCSKISKMFPGHPSRSEFDILSCSTFHPKVGAVKSMRNGRILLVGDAAHLCNPIGGYGLSGGVADAGSLADYLFRIHDGLDGLDALDAYSRERLAVYRGLIEPATRTRMQHLSGNPQDCAAQHGRPSL